MATATFYPTGTSGTGWTDPTNIYADDANYVTRSISSGAAAVTLTATTFLSSGDAPSDIISAEATINSVVFSTEWRWSADPGTSSLKLTVGTDSYNDTTKPTTLVVRSVSYTGATDLATLDGITAAFQASISATGTSRTCYNDYIKMVIDYTESTPVTVNVGNAAGATAAAPTPSVSGAASVSVGNAAGATAAAKVPSVSGAAVVTAGNAAAAVAAALVSTITAINTTYTFTRDSTAYKLDGSSVSSGVKRVETINGNLGMMVEEGTPNLLTANLASVETGTSGFGKNWGTETLTRDTSEYWQGAASLKTVTPGGGTNEGWYAPNTFLAVSASLWYTASVWLKGSGTVNLVLGEWTSASAFIGQASLTITLTSTWMRYSVSRLFGATGVKALIGVATSSKQAITFYADGLQIEQKAYATSWQLPGSARASETLTIPTTGMSPSAGTIEWLGYIDSMARRRVSGQFPEVFRLPRNDDLDGGIVLRHEATSANWTLVTYDDEGTTSSVSFVDSNTPDGRHCFAVTWDADHAYAYIDGVLRGTIDTPRLPTTLGSNALVGYSSATSYLNTYHNLVRVSNTVHDADRIAADYETLIFSEAIDTVSRVLLNTYGVEIQAVAATATATALTPSVTGAAIVTVGNAAAATAATAAPAVSGAAVVTVDNAAVAAAEALAAEVHYDWAVVVGGAASAIATALTPPTIITDAILAVENAATAAAAAPVPAISGDAVVAAVTAKATALAYEAVISGGATVTAGNAAAAIAQALTHSIAADANISVGNAASATAAAKDAIIGTGWTVNAVPATATAAGISGATVTGTAVVTAGNAAAAAAAGVSGATVSGSAVVSAVPARAAAAGKTDMEVIEGYLLKIINVGNAASATAAALAPHIALPQAILKAIKRPNYAHVDPATRNATDELIKNIQTYASGSYLKLNEKARPTGLASLTDESLVVQEPASKGQASGIASLDGSSLVVQNPASATATPTASSIPIADSSGKMATGWIPRIPVNLTMLSTSSVVTWTDMPAALTEFDSSTWYRTYTDLTYATQARLQVAVYTAGCAGSKIRLQYSLDNGSNWAYLDGSGGPSVSIAAQGFFNSDWVNIAAAGKASVMIRIVGIDGDGAADPKFAYLNAQFQ